MLMARMATVARVQKGSQVHTVLFKSAFTLSDQKMSLPTLPKVFPSRWYMAIYILHGDMNVSYRCSLGPSSLSDSP